MKSRFTIRASPAESRHVEMSKLGGDDQRESDHCGIGAFCGLSRPSSVRRAGSPTQVAHVLSCSVSEVYRLAHRGHLIAYRHGARSLRIYWDSVATFQQARELGGASTRTSTFNGPRNRHKGHHAAMAALRKFGVTKP